MKPVVFFSVLILLSTFPGVTQADTQPSITWFKVAGGGGVSTSGVYSVSGTIGQSEAGGSLTGGAHSITGGFWSVTAVQTSGAPLLAITVTNNLVVVSWMVSAEPWILESTNRLSPLSVSWPSATGTYSTNANRLQVVEPLVAGPRFYRLRKP